MYLTKTIGFAILALAPAATVATPQEAAPTDPAPAAICHKTSPTYGEVCADRDRKRCMVENRLSGAASRFTWYIMYYGDVRNGWNGMTWHVQTPANGGALELSSEDVNGGQGIRPTCWFDHNDDPEFNCYNSDGLPYLWYHNDVDNSVGLGLSVPDGATQFQAYWMNLD